MAERRVLDGSSDADSPAREAALEEFCHVFRLEPVRVKIGRNSSSTPVPDINKFMGKVVFEEWTDFEDDVKASMKRIQDTTIGEDLQDSLLFAEAARRQIDPTPIREGLLSTIPDRFYEGMWDSEYSSIAADPNQGRTIVKRKPVFGDETSLMGVFSNIFSSVTSLVQHMCGDNRLIVTSKYMDSVEAITRANMATSSSEPAPRKGKRVLPDGTLMRLKKVDDTTGKPICCFELKGPEKCVTGRPGEPADCFAINIHEGMVNVAPQDRVTELPSPHIMDNSANLAKRLGKMFRTGRLSDNVQTADTAMKPIAQALRYALSSMSGYSYICNIASGVAIKLERGKRERQFIAKVALVQELPGRSVGHICAMTHLSIAALQRIRRISFLEDDLDEMRQIYEHADTRFEHEGRDTEDAGPSRKRSRGNGGDSASRDPRLAKAQNDGQKENCEKSCMDTESSATNTTDTHSGLTSVTEALISEVFEIMESRTALLGSGMSGKVEGAVWKGRKVAVKTWTYDSEEGVVDLCHEIGMYRFLEKNHHEVLGTAIPGLVKFWNLLHSVQKVPAKVGLVMDRVGDQVFLAGKDLYVENSKKELRKLSTEDRDALKEAAVHSLERLHEARIAHGDIEFRNMRVAQLTSGDPKSWQVWWIDLGQAMFMQSKESLALKAERSSCEDLFPRT